jgi:hypothetical protein
MTSRQPIPIELSDERSRRLRAIAIERQHQQQHLSNVRDDDITCYGLAVGGDQLEADED